MAEWDAWIGREERRSDMLGEGLAARWLATLDRSTRTDAIMPQGIHWCLCTPDAATAHLGEDGHPQRDDTPASFLPPVPLPRRMWASSKVEFLAPISIGATVDRVSRVASITEKTGGSGTLVFVVIEHTTYTGADAAIREEQTLVYRAAADADAPLSPPETGAPAFDQNTWDAHRRLVPSEPLLFRYSALTFNSHRIHYDAPYARGEERYRGLVVHGPLTATLLLQLAAQEFGDNRLASFTFRGMSPAIAGEPLHLVLREENAEITLGAFADDRRQVMQASASLSDKT